MRVACLFVIVALVAASALSLASASPVERRELVTVETGMAVDPIGVVRSVTLTTGVSFNAFCEFIVPFLDFELPPGVCSNDLFDNRWRLDEETPSDGEEDYETDVEPQAWESSRRRGGRSRSPSRVRSMHRG